MAFYDAIPASDGTSLVAPTDAEFKVFEVTDTARANPLPLRTVAGTNAAPLVTTAQGVVPPVEVVSPNFEHIFQSGGWEWRRESSEGIKRAALSAQASAEEAVTLVKKPTDEAVADGITRADIPGTVAKTVAAQPSVVAAAAAAVDANPKIAELDKKIWPTRDLGSGSDLDTIVGAAGNGHYRLLSPNILNAPGAFIGHVDSLYNSADGRTVQVFTRSNSGPLVQYSRVHSSGAWSAWMNHGWVSASPAASVDLNTLRSPGIISIQNTTHANQPVPAVGTLEVLPSSGVTLQRFTTWETEPRVFQRRATSATAWGAWSEFGARPIPITPATPAIPTISATETPRSAGEIVVALNADRTKGYNNYSTTLRETTDDGATWAAIKTFPGMSLESVTPLANGEIMVSTTDGANIRRVYVSNGYPASGAAATWDEKFQGSARYVKFTSSWSIFAHQNIVLVNEYGPKSGSSWSGTTEVIATGANARYTRLSLDYGKTWRVIFDLNAFTASKGLSGDGQHLHGVAWDKYWDRIWLTFGDNLGGAGANGVLYSDDLGDTWKVAQYWSGAGNTTQVVGILPMPKCVLFAGDMNPSGLMRINRSEGKQRAGSYTYELAYDAPASKGTHLCHGITRHERPGDDGTAFFGFGAEGSSAPSLILATPDGYAISTIYEDATAQPSGFGLRSVVGPTLRGNLIIASNRNGTWSEIKGKAPGY